MTEATTLVGIPLAAGARIRHRIDISGNIAHDEHDIEFGFADGRLFLLQRRPITHA